MTDGRPPMLDTYRSILRRRWSMVVLATLIMAPMAFLALTSSSGVYRSTSVVQVLTASVAEGLLGTSRSYQEPERLLASEIEVLESRVVAQGAVQILRDDGVQSSADAIAEAVTVAPRGMTSFIEVVGTDPSAQRARLLTSAVVESYQNYKLGLQRDELQRLDQELRTRLASTEAELLQLDAAGDGDSGSVARQRAAVLGRYESLSNLIEDVRLRLSVDTSGVEVLTPATVAEQESGALAPVPAGVVAALGALALALGLAVVIDLLRDPVRTREEAQRVVRAGFSMALPRSPSDGAALAELLGDRRSRTARAAAVLQERTLAHIETTNRRHVLVVSAAEDRRQRPYVATALAVAAARSGWRVLLVGERVDRSLLTDGDDLAVLSAASEDASAWAHPTRITGLWWAAAPGEPMAAGDVTGRPRSADFEVVVHVQDGEDLFGSTEDADSVRLVVATLGRTRSRHLVALVRQLTDLGDEPTGLVVVDTVRTRTGLVRRSARKASPPAAVPATQQRSDEEAVDTSPAAARPPAVTPGSRAW